eukprot:TRINITY_DN1992_c0_g1_i1.p1 TRINITY_DN1992_c0_g1~~TRINITY_DN1992_c0_g1_i1.p1  ORF type:complete len:443 (-),score=56.41 TRINITY_DN1992_c0_g1_i1:60-1349(-)
MGNRIKAMKIGSTRLILFAAFISFSLAFNPLPQEEWVSDTIDLGNGGDKMFYALVKCKECRQRNPPTVPPLIMWLHGGPGGPSTVVLFLTVGPHVMNSSYKFEKNPYSWVKYADVMFVDNPVGTAYSGNKDNTTLCRDEKCIARNLYTLMTKFMEKNPEYRGRPFYIAGESYAGHYAPAFGAYLVRSQNKDINFVGAAVGNGFMDLYAQHMQDADFLLYNKNITVFEYAIYKTLSLGCVVARDIHLHALDTFCSLLIFSIAEVVGIPFPYDITQGHPNPEEMKQLFAFLNDTKTKDAFGVKDRNFDLNNDHVLFAMLGDFVVSVMDDIAYCLDNGKKFIFWFGDKDLVCHWMGGYSAVKQIPWKEKEAFNNAPEKPWKDNEGREFGTIIRQNKLTYIRVFNGGHSIFRRQRIAGLELLRELLKLSLIHI